MNLHTFRSILSGLALLLLAGCGPGLRPQSSAFIAVGGEPLSIDLDQNEYLLDDSTPALPQRAEQIDFGPWGKEKVDRQFSKSITNLLVGAVEWNDIRNLYELSVGITIQDQGKSAVGVDFPVSFDETSLREGKTIQAISSDRAYVLQMRCVSNDCSEKVFRLQRLKDGAITVMKNLRAEEMMTPIDNKGKEAQPVPVVQQYSEVKEGQTRWLLIERDGNAKDLKPILTDKSKLKNMRVRRAIDVKPLDDSTTPGISKLSISEKLVWIGELFIQQKVGVLENACNRFILNILAASGYKITSEPVSDRFLTLFKLDSSGGQFKGWKSESYRFRNAINNDRKKLFQRLSALPERRGVIMQWGREQRAHGHVALLFREGSKFYTLESMINTSKRKGEPPHKEAKEIKHLLSNYQPNLNVIFPPDIAK